MQTHELKCWPVYFAAMASGRKTFLYRKDDWRFCEGDQLIIREWDDGAKQYTGREIRRTITYIMRSGGPFPMQDGYVILGLGPEYTGVRGCEKIVI